MISIAQSSNLENIKGLKPELLPISGWEREITSVVQHDNPVFLSTTNITLDKIKAGFACALHMHQPTIPAGKKGELICNLQNMFENQEAGNNHNAESFAWCYRRMGEFIPQIVDNGGNPRIMLDYSGNLLWGFQQMQSYDIINDLKRITCNSQYQPYVEWLGTMWSHAVVSSTPIIDLKLQIQAWRHHFASILVMMP